MPRDLGASRHPHAFSSVHVRKEAVERTCAARPAHDAAVETDRHHPAALLVELFERVDEVIVELVGRHEPVDEQELEVVGVERVRDDQVVASFDGDPVRQLVCVRVRVVEKASLLDDETARVLGDAARVPADRALPADTLDRLDRAPDIGSLLFLGHFEVVDPAPAMARDLPACVDHRAGSHRTALERLPDRVHRQRQPMLGEDPVHTPEARAAAELERRFR